MLIPLVLLVASQGGGKVQAYSSGQLVGAADLRAVSDKRFRVKEVARFWIDQPSDITELQVALAGKPGTNELHFWRDIDHEWPFYRFERDLASPIRIVTTKQDLNKWRTVSLGPRRLKIDNAGYVYVGLVVKPGSPTLAIDKKLDNPKFCRYEVFDTKTPRAAKAYWVRPAGDYAIKVTTRPRPPVRRMFTDVTSQVGLSGSSGQSVAWADIDGDGWEDLILSGLTVRVFKNRKGDSFQDITRESGLAHSANIAVFADLDGDGDQDALLGSDDEDGVDRVFLNRGTGRFAFSQTLKDSGPTKCATYLDYDLDGKLDLFLANGADGVKTRNSLWLNVGKGRFVPAPLKELAKTSVAFSRSAVAADLDGDGRSEVAVGTLRLQPDQLWWFDKSKAKDRAKGFHFDLARSPGGKLTGGQGAGVAIADLDNDAKPDVWVANLMHPDWRGYEASVLSAFFMSRGSGLFRRFDADAMGLDFDESPADPTLGDFDNDGDVDAYVGSSYHHGDYYENVGGRFRNQTYRSGIETDRCESSAVSDFDHDGRLDLIVAGKGGVKFYRNVSPIKSWLEVDLKGKQVIGASVLAIANGKKQLRQAVAGKGLGSQDSRVLHFGLGTALKVDEIVIRWPGGRASRVKSPGANRRVAVKQAS